MTEATTETMTATVHVLKLGNRQITMGIYRQLDSAEHADIEPIGRVRDRQDMNGQGLYVIGRHKTTGALVRTVYMRPRELQAYATHEDWKSKHDRFRSFEDSLPLIILAGAR